MDEMLGVVMQEGWINFLWKPAAHFLLSGLAGLLAYWWISTTEYRCSYGDTWTPQSLKGDFGIHPYSLYLALSFALWVHVLQDYTLNWF